MSEASIRIQDDLFQAVNGEWLKTAVIPDDRPTAGGFAELDQNVEKLMMADLSAFAKGEKTSDIPEMKYAIELYKKTLDVQERNEKGISPVLPLLEKIRGLKRPQDLNEQAAAFLLDGIRLPLQIFVDTDMKDATRHALNLMGPDIILPDTTYYEEGNPAGQQLLQIHPRGPLSCPFPCNVCPHSLSRQCLNAGSAPRSPGRGMS